MCKHTAVNEVQQELAKPENKGVLASVNTETGEVTATFMAPKPYWEVENDAGDTGTLTPAEVKALTREHDELVTKLPRLKKAERSKATTRINVIEGLLRRQRSNEEAVRRSLEREAERPAQRYGTPGNSAPAAETNKLTWASLRADLDAKARAAQAALATDPICCTGKYLCSKCKAKAGV
jgi:hypothetical protein